MERLYQLRTKRDGAGAAEPVFPARKHSRLPLGPPSFPPPEPVTRAWVYRKKIKGILLKLLSLFYSTHTWWSINRELMGRFVPENMLQRYSQYRRGDCNRCGACCKIPFECLFLGEDEGGYYCKIYQTPYAMVSCKHFPFTPSDLQEVYRYIGGPENCTIWFDGEPEPLSFAEAVSLYVKGVREAYRRRHPKPSASSEPLSS